jgi:hypothetical protein
MDLMSQPINLFAAHAKGLAVICEGQQVSHLWHLPPVTLNALSYPVIQLIPQIEA